MTKGFSYALTEAVPKTRLDPWAQTKPFPHSRDLGTGQLLTLPDPNLYN